MLIQSARHSALDLERWQLTEEQARVHAQLRIFERHVQRAQAALLSFTGSDRCYAGVSWGKDSVVLAHLIATLVPRVPLVWVRVDPDYNPDCPLVRDVFLRAHPGVAYDEIIVQRSGIYRAHGTLEAGMRIAAERYGARYISGVRSEESSDRRRRMRSWGEASANTCAPLGWWSAWDVFAYLTTRGLPVHPAYACTMDGLLDPTKIRVSPLGGARGQRTGDGMGRAEWEQRYYGRELTRLAK